VPDGYGDRVPDPARSAAGVFRAHLRASGVRVGAPVEGGAGEGGAVVGRVRSAPVVEIVQHVLETSDNEAAEVLLRHVALGRGLPGSSSAGVQAATEVLSGLGVALQGARWYDGSGLSRRNRLAVGTLVDVLVTGLRDPALARVVSGLPVAGFTGSLSDRFVVRSDAGLGRVRAKTGTLTGVSGLAGVVRTRDGAVLVYVAVADRVREADTLWVRARLDRISAALAGCRCRG
jgi:D-alanyl-D-alanine carboxypeptidase/D-alanyl-D-alanine-endopeptidase (penicillin-binding protein 4)